MTSTNNNIKKYREVDSLFLSPDPDTSYELFDDIQFIKLKHRNSNICYKNNISSSKKKLINLKINNGNNKSKIVRRDAKGVPIIKKNNNKHEKIKQHITFIDEVDETKNLVNVTFIQSYKKYNKEVLFEENDNYNKKIMNKCCLIF